jgi:hypothetical protein
LISIERFVGKRAVIKELIVVLGQGAKACFNLSGAIAIVREIVSYGIGRISVLDASSHL